MTNAERYKTAEERAKAFLSHCTTHRRCDGCVFKEKFGNPFMCSFNWLDLEAEVDKPLPCPFCGHEVKIGNFDNGKVFGVFIHCDCCHFSTANFTTCDELVKMWNTRAAKDKGAK